MHRTIIAGLGAALLCGCSEDAPKPEKPAKAAALKAGEYEVTGTVAALTSADQTTPATPLKANAPLEPVRACVAADGKLEPKMFAERSDECSEDTAFVRNGRLNVQLRCRRAGNGIVMQLANGTFTEDSFEAEVLTSTAFAGSGDYNMTRKLSGKRVGDCASEAAAQ